MNRPSLFSLLRCLTPAALLACAEPPPETDDTDTPAEETDTPADTDAAEEVLTAYDDVPTAARCPVDDDGTNCLERARNAFRVDDEATLELSSTAERVGGQFEGEVCADLVVGLQPSIGAVCEIPVVNITVFEEEVKLPAFSRNIGADLCTSWSGPAPTDCDPSSGCCTDGECPPNTEDPSLTVSCDRGPQLVGGLYRYSCETHIPDGWCLTGSETAGDVTCDDGLEATVDECVENQCVNSYPLIDNLPVDNYAACPAIAVDCCFVDSDCNDGVPGTDDVCQKDPGEGPNARGTCSHEVGLPPRF